MQESARYQAIFEIIEQVFSDKQPADNILNSYFRERRYIGSKDRRFISENVWDIIRHRRRLEFEAQSTSIRKLMIVWAKNKSLETVFGELEDLIRQMENKDTSLEESFKLYTSGMKLIKYCNDSLDKVEKKLIEVSEEE